MLESNEVIDGGTSKCSIVISTDVRIWASSLEEPGVEVLALAAAIFRTTECLAPTLTCHNLSLLNHLQLIRARRVQVHRATGCHAVKCSAAQRLHYHGEIIPVVEAHSVRVQGAAVDRQSELRHGSRRVDVSTINTFQAGRATITCDAGKFSGRTYRTEASSPYAP